MQRVVIIITDDSVGVEDLPENVLVEIRDYRTDQIEQRDGDPWVIYDEGGRRFVQYCLTGGNTT